MSLEFLVVRLKIKEDNRGIHKRVSMKAKAHMEEGFKPNKKKPISVKNIHLKPDQTKEEIRWRVLWLWYEGS